MDKKKIIIIAGAGLIILAILLVVVYLPAKENQPSEVLEGNTKAPVLMTGEEKQSLGLQADTKVEVLGRDEQGEVSSYRILRDDKGYPLK